MPTFPTYKELIMEPDNISGCEVSGCEVSGNLIKDMENKTLEAGYDLLKFCQEKLEATQDNETKATCRLQIATSESLTAGLIMSTLVKLPVSGWAKYGCCGVYDTDAKRVYLNVQVDDVYTHRCAKEMAIGMLNNSTATLAISVTGNAMPYFTNLDRLGEVFIGIATYAEYNGKDSIIYTTKAVNCCLGMDEESQFKDKCKEWLKPHKLLTPDRTGKEVKVQYPPRKSTAEISLLIRNYTAYAAMKLATDFLVKHSNKLKTPSFITTRRNKNNDHSYLNYHLHTSIPHPKYSNILPEIALSMDGNITNEDLKIINEIYERSQYTATLSGDDWVNSLSLKGGNNKSKKKKGRKTKKKKTKKKKTKIP
jgi:nicotinamide mononucleotide (NMN) deamidase PncC